jgi:glyoxylase-like metal-dependent hydrolase (beta-lactamase superfamily II)
MTREFFVFIKSFVAGPWQTNCYLVAPGPNSECIVIDPGQNALPQIQHIVAEYKLKPIAVMVTHGHLDHMWSVFPIASGYQIPAFVHSADRHLLTDPGAGLSKETREMLPQLIGENDKFVEPDEVIELADKANFNIAGLDFVVRHTPGHTAGSVIFSTTDSIPKIFTGDTLFAGAIGRTDLPGSSPDEMNNSLREVICGLPPQAEVFPGHGPTTQMETELTTNQYLLRIQQGLPAA